MLYPFSAFLQCFALYDLALTYDIEWRKGEEKRLQRCRGKVGIYWLMVSLPGFFNVVNTNSRCTQEKKKKANSGGQFSFIEKKWGKKNSRTRFPNFVLTKLCGFNVLFLFLYSIWDCKMLNIFLFCIIGFSAKWTFPILIAFFKIHFTFTIPPLILSPY